MIREIYILCQNDFPHSAYVDEDEAKAQRLARQIDEDAKPLYAGRKSYWHVETIELKDN